MKVNSASLPAVHRTLLGYSTGIAENDHFPKHVPVRRVCGGSLLRARHNGRCDPKDTQLKSLTREGHMCVYRVAYLLWGLIPKC